jgi:hypothetical protein
VQDYKQYDVVLLLGLGIGVTPMTIIKDIINNMKRQAATSSPTPDGDLESDVRHINNMKRQDGDLESDARRKSRQLRSIRR